MMVSKKLMGKNQIAFSIASLDWIGCDGDVWVYVSDREADIVFSFYPAMGCIDCLFTVFS